MREMYVDLIDCGIDIAAPDDVFDALDHYIFLSSRPKDMRAKYYIKCELTSTLAETSRYLAQAGTRVDVINSHTSHQYVRYTHSDGFLLLPRSRDFHFLIVNGPGQVSLYASDRNAAGKALLRIIRAILINALPAYGWVKLHTALVSVGDRGIMLCGPSGSGKTSLLLNILARPRTSFCAGDRILIKRFGNFLRAISIPLAVRWIQGQHPAILSDFFDAGHGARRPEESHDDKLEVTPKDLVELFGSDRISGCQVTDLVFVQHDHSLASAAVTMPSRSLALKILNEQKFPSDDPIFPGGWVGFSPVAQLEDLQPIVDAFVRAPIALSWRYPLMSDAVDALLNALGIEAEHVERD